MKKIILTSIATAATLVSAPVAAQEADIVVRADVLAPAPNNDTNKFWLDYKTDISEAKRELVSDLERATDEEDRREAYGEYFIEIADAKSDYSEEMLERGYRVVDFQGDGIDFAAR